MIKFILNQYWTFSGAVFSLAKTISSVRRIRRDFAPLSDCVKQAKALLFEESMQETDKMLSQGHVQAYAIKTKDGYNYSVHYTTGRFERDSLEDL